MPYQNIVFVKLRLKILSDIRFTDQLDDEGKLVFLGLLLLAGRTQNKIPNNPTFIKRHLNLAMSEQKISEKIGKICSIFPSVSGNSEIVKFKKFNKIHNWCGKSYGKPSETQDKNRIDKEKIKNKKAFLLHFSDKHQESTGVKYLTTYGKDDRLINELLDIYSLENLKELVDAYFEVAENPKEWCADKLSVGTFRHMIPQIIGRLRKKVT